MREVGRGRDLGGEVEIVSGLKPGETVVVDGAFLLKAQAERSLAKARNTSTEECRHDYKNPERLFRPSRADHRARLAASVLGAVWLQDLRRDVFPDLSAPVFNVIVQNPAMGAEELETGVAVPLEVALAGLPEVRRIRSTSLLGVTQVTVEFESDADYYRSRQFVAERVNQAAAQLPPGTEAPNISSLTGRLNEIFEFTLEADPGTADPMVLRDLAEFEVRNRLLAVPGVASIERLGGYLRQFQVQLDPERMSARGITLDEVEHAVQGSNINAAGGFVTEGSIEWTVRAVGRAKTWKTCAAPWSP